MFSTQKFFNLELRSLGFIIAVTSIFYHVFGHIDFEDYDEDDHTIFKKDIFGISFSINKHKPKQVITEGGDVLSEDDFLDIMSILLSCENLIYEIVTLIVCPLLLVALIKKRPGLILPWLIYWAVSLISNWVICVVVIIYMTSVDAVISAERMSYTVHQSMAMGLYFALWVAMVSLHREEKKENTS